jgi:hypothetical protein
MREFKNATAHPERMASEEIARHELKQSGALLSETMYGAEGCWIFLLQKNLLSLIQPHAIMFTAYAIPKTIVEPKFVYDFRETPRKCKSTQMLGRCIHSDTH